MMSTDDRDERPSWSEIDKRKDRSSHVTREKSESRRKPSARDEWVKKQYKKEIDKLFKGTKEETEEQKKARKEIANTYGTNKFNNAVKQYVKQYGLPGDWSTLILMLDHKDKAVVVETLEELRKRAAESSAAEQEGFKSRVKIIAMTAEDESLRDCAEHILLALEDLGD